VRGALLMIEKLEVTMDEHEVREAIATAFHRVLIERGLAVQASDVEILVEDGGRSDPIVTATFKYSGEIPSE
jgi:hypothetical protein